MYVASSFQEDIKTNNDREVNYQSIQLMTTSQQKIIVQPKLRWTHMEH